jgi:dTDP-glucose 4,6-dehydratase
VLHILGKSENLLTTVTDRLGHDRRYAVDCSKITAELGWRPAISFSDGLQATVEWYQKNSGWVRSTKSGEYRNYYQKIYGEKLA